MGFKSKSKQSVQSNNCNPFKVGGLIFESEDDYKLFKHLDRNIAEIIKTVNDGIIELKDAFNNIKSINVKESYYDAREEMDGMFENATKLLCYEGTRFHIDYKVGCRFFDKIRIINYSD